MDPTSIRISEQKELDDSKNFPTRKDEIWRFVNVGDLAIFNTEPSVLKASDSTETPPYAESVSHFSANKFYGDLPDSFSIEYKKHDLTFNTIDHIANKNVSFIESAIPTLTLKAKTESSHTVCVHTIENNANWNRVHIIAEEGSQTELNLHTWDLENTISTLSTEISIEVKKGATLKLSILSRCHTDSLVLQGINATLARDSILEITEYNPNIKASRIRYKIDLNEENAEVKLTGCAILSDKQQSHQYIEINHNAPHCRSFQLFKTLLLDQTKASFDGTVFVKEGAGGTEANQLNNNLLLSKNARVYTKPRMKIKASDVRCNHGATTGSLNEDEIFYLVSRGLSREKAINTLSLGFIRGALNDCSHKKTTQWWLEQNTKHLSNL